MATQRSPRNRISDPNKDLKKWLQRTLAVKLRVLLSCVKRAQAGDNNESVHKLRLATRRLAALLNIFRDWFPRKRWETHRKMLRRLIRAAGISRERDVFISMMTERHDPHPVTEDVVLMTLLSRKNDEREDALQELRAGLQEFDRKQWKRSFTELIAEARYRR